MTLAELFRLWDDRDERYAGRHPSLGGGWRAGSRVGYNAGAGDATGDSGGAPGRASHRPGHPRLD